MSETAPTPAGRIAGLVAALVAALALIVLAFSWPSVTADPRDLPVAIAGDAEAVAAVIEAVDAAQPGAIAFTEVDGRAAAVAAIEAREVYGAILLGETPEVLTASAASPVVAQLLTGVAGTLREGLQARMDALAAASGQPAPVVTVPITDVVPLSEGDPRGSGFAAAIFPLLIGGIIGGVGMSLAVRGAGRRLAAVLGFAAIGALTLAGILQGWFGSLQGPFWGNVAAIGLGLLAIAAPIVGLSSVLGRAGIAVGAVIVMLVGNPIAGAAMPREFLPAPWGAVGQWLPPGAIATLLRDVSYFPAADATFPWLVLAGWAAVGLALLGLGALRRPEPAAG
jgi:hypothetical protein